MPREERVAVGCLSSLLGGLASGVATSLFIIFPVRAVVFGMLGLVYTPHPIFGVGGQWNKPWGDDVNTAIVWLGLGAGGAVALLVFWLIWRRAKRQID